MIGLSCSAQIFHSNNKNQTAQGKEKQKTEIQTRQPTKTRWLHGDASITSST